MKLRALVWWLRKGKSSIPIFVDKDIGKPCFLEAGILWAQGKLTFLCNFKMMLTLWKQIYEIKLCPWLHKWSTRSNLTWKALCTKPPFIRTKKWALIFKPVWVRFSVTCKRKHWKRYGKNLYWSLTLLLSSFLKSLNFGRNVFSFWENLYLIQLGNWWHY